MDQYRIRSSTRWAETMRRPKAVHPCSEIPAVVLCVWEWIERWKRRERSISVRRGEFLLCCWAQYSGWIAFLETLYFTARKVWASMRDPFIEGHCRSRDDQLARAEIAKVEGKNGEPRFFNMLLRYTASRHGRPATDSVTMR
jgi:hypothetical protein